MLKLSELRHNQRPSGVKVLAKFIRRGFSVVVIKCFATYNNPMLFCCDFHNDPAKPPFFQ